MPADPTAAPQEQKASAGVAPSNTLRALDFSLIRQLLVVRAGTASGKEGLADLAPLDDEALVRRSLALTAEARSLLGQLGLQPYAHLPGLEEIWATLRLGTAAALSPSDLLVVSSFVDRATDILRGVAGCESAPSLASLARRVPDMADVSNNILRAVAAPGDVLDSASPRLAQVRRDVQTSKARLQRLMDELLRDPRNEPALQDQLILTRNDRSVLLVRAGQRQNIPGVVHGVSGSGASVFVEPLPAVELNNSVVALCDEERAEIERILRELTDSVRSRREDLALAEQVLSRLDVLQAKAILARDMDAQEPQLGQGYEIDLPQARHPLLMRAVAHGGDDPSETQDAVPQDIQIAPPHRALLISGPNAGGKTVTLKTVGVLALMAQCGLHIPAAPGCRLPVFRRIFAEIGDEQSLTQNLSTYSARLRGIVEMLHDFELPALVILDEVGSGTDPTEGAALGIAIIEHFIGQGALVLASTHHGTVKRHAQATAGILSASLGYDPDRYTPTFELLLGQSGRSLALEIAERMGLPSTVLTGARSRLDAAVVNLEDAARSLERERAQVRDQLSELELQRTRLARQLSEAEQERLAAKERDREERERLRRRFEDVVRDHREKARQSVIEALDRLPEHQRRGARPDRQVRNEMATRLAEIDRQAEVTLGLEPDSGPLIEAPKEGQWVVVPSFSARGVVVSVPSAQELELDVDGKRLRVPLDAVRPLSAPPPKKEGRAWIDRDTGAEAPADCNVIGLAAEEALERVDKFLDVASLADRGEVRVIHGTGTGKLRRAVAGLLTDHPHVASFGPADPRAGGKGVTVVVLKE
jgi:DNA mismatch repair protein MutS2